MAKATGDTTPIESLDAFTARKNEQLRQKDEQLQQKDEQLRLESEAKFRNSSYLRAAQRLYALNLKDDPDQPPAEALPPSPTAVQAVAPPQQSDKQPPPPVNPTGAGAWLKAKFERMRDAGEIPKDVRRVDLAKLLEKQMNEAADASGYVQISGTGKSVRKVQWRHINTSLSEWGMWPI
jgi:hypothetical protein